jgi:3-hydroxyacyl-[acyl-carrier-protein] dehydratase
MNKALTHEEVMEILPHRDPMLLIDTVTELEPGRRVVAKFYADFSREIFKGHFPGAPVLPGVYMVEAAAQAADILLMTLDRYAGKIPLFLGINSASFKKKIQPGDTLEIHAELLSERPEKAIGVCKCAVYTNGELAGETEVALAMR